MIGNLIRLEDVECTMRERHVKGSAVGYVFGALEKSQPADPAACRRQLTQYARTAHGPMCVGDRQKVASNVSRFTYVHSPGSSEGAVVLSEKSSLPAPLDEVIHPSLPKFGLAHDLPQLLVQRLVAAALVDLGMGGGKKQVQKWLEVHAQGFFPRTVKITHESPPKNCAVYRDMGKQVPAGLRESRHAGRAVEHKGV
jgi:hypothetical protein